MKNILLLMLLMAVLCFSCSSSSRGLFSKKTPHEKYAEKLDDTGLEDTPEGRQWLTASKTALEQPYTIELPFKLEGYFATDKARALGLSFTAKQGERLLFTLNKKAPTDFVLYADLFQLQGMSTSLLHAADTAQTQFSVDVEETGSYVLRLQPELFKSGNYSLAVSVGPSLSFPVAGAKAKAGSFWGADRDGGKRSHEGVDIFAPKGTQALAIADGRITGVREGGLGGKVVWLRPDNKNYTLYYAHLDTQLVQEGQHVTKGEVVGLVGNTGNAKYTPSHLHFGVYTYNGAIDPYPFINPAIKSGSNVPKKTLTNYLRLIKAQKLGVDETLVPANSLLVPLAVTSKGYISELPNGQLAQLPFAMVKVETQPVKNTAILASQNTANRKERM